MPDLRNPKFLHTSTKLNTHATDMHVNATGIISVKTVILKK